MKIAITGETGFLGYHLTQYFKYQLKYDVISLTRDYQTNIELIKTCDWLIHSAGINRNLTFSQNNLILAKELVSLLVQHNININIAYASSVQEFYNTEYGNDKANAGKILSDYCMKIDSKFISYKLPNLFGPFSKPNYNSVVSTFCYNIINNKLCYIDDNKIDLCYVYDAIQAISLDDTNPTYITSNITIKSLHELLNQYHLKYSQGIIPELNSKFDIQLFNTYRSFADFTHKLTRHIDNRGYLIELLKSENSQSQIFCSVTKPGITRGNHFHFNKIERFCILKGTAKILLRKLGSDKIIQHILNEDTDTIIDIPILYTHNITNISDSELICVFWANEIFDKENTDTYFIKV
jgi:UDP-2-acetamido-2,6-beta-L-arabino-hexul-4-ose reductase